MRILANVAEPAESSDAATKQYVDNAIQTLTTQITALTEQLQTMQAKLTEIEQNYMPINPTASAFDAKATTEEHN